MRKKRKGYKFLLVLMVLAGGLAAVMVFSPLLLLSDIRVNGAEKYTEEEIIQASGIERDEHAMHYLGGSMEHLLQLRMGKAEKQVESLPWVKKALIRYEFPRTVHIDITQRHAIAWIRHMGNYLLIDEEGYVMEVGSDLDDQYPEIRGVQSDKFTIGGKLETKEPEKIIWLVQLLQSLNQVDANSQQTLIAVLDWMDILQDKDVYLSLDGRITAKIKMDNELTYRLSYLKVLYYNHIMPDEKGMIDFYDKDARFIEELPEGS